LAKGKVKPGYMPEDVSPSTEVPIKMRRGEDVVRKKLSSKTQGGKLDGTKGLFGREYKRASKETVRERSGKTCSGVVRTDRTLGQPPNWKGGS